MKRSIESLEGEQDGADPLILASSALEGRHYIAAQALPPGFAVMKADSITFALEESERPLRCLRCGIRCLSEAGTHSCIKCTQLTCRACLTLTCCTSETDAWECVLVSRLAYASSTMILVARLLMLDRDTRARIELDLLSHSESVDGTTMREFEEAAAQVVAALPAEARHSPHEAVRLLCILKANAIAMVRSNVRCVDPPNGCSRGTCACCVR